MRPSLALAALIAVTAGATAAPTPGAVEAPPSPPTAGAAPGHPRSGEAPRGPAPVECAHDAAAPRRLTVGEHASFQPGLLLQGWLLAERADETTSTFRVRRAELHVKGDIVPGALSYGVMLDAAKVLEFQDRTLPVSDQDPPPSDPTRPEAVTAKQPVSPVSMLQDAVLTATSRAVDVSFGQLKAPVSWEGYHSSSTLLFPERALVARAFGDQRDLGLRLSKTFTDFGYVAGVFNGSGPNRLDTDDDKDLALRLEAYPTAGLAVAGAVYVTVGERTSGAKDRYEADVRYERGPLLLQAEYLRARDLGRASPATEAHGFYAAVAWTFFGVVQPALRVGALDPDLHADADPSAAGGKDEVWHFDAGLNVLLRKHEAKLQLSYSRLHYDTRAASDTAILAAQVSY